jgi:hypothetical protein
MPLNPLGKFKNSLKLDARASGTPVIEGPVYGGGAWAAIRGDGNLVTSTNGVDWTNGIQVTTSITPKLFYLNSHWVVLSLYSAIDNNLNAQGQQVAQAMVISTSTDLTTWTDITARYTNVNNQVVGTGTIDSANFRQANNARTTKFRDLSYSNGYYLAVGEETGTTARSASVYKSADLITWVTAYTLNPGAATVNTSTRIRSQGMTVVITADLLDGANRIPFVFYSTTGAVSFSVPTNGYNDVGNHSLNSIAYGAGNWLAVGNGGMLYSHYNPQTGSGAIGGTWNQRTGPTNTATVNWQSVEYINNKWLLVGSKYNAVTARYEEQFYTSTNLITWIQQTTPQTDIINVTQAFGNSRQTIATDGTRTVAWQWTTTDLANWTAVNYRIPNQQPYLDYGQDNRYGTWKTMDFWVYVAALDPNFVQYPIASAYLNDTNYWAVYLVAQDGHRPYVTFTSSDTALNSSGVVLSSVTNLDGGVITGQWNHIRIVRNTGVGAIYINGAFDVQGNTTFTAPSGALPAAGHMTIGRIGDGFESYRARNTDYWIDEFTLNFNPLNSPSAQTITVPTERGFSTDTTLLLLHFDYNYLDDASLPITADSPFVAQAVLQATATRVLRTSAQSSASVTQVTTASRVRSAQAQLSALATQLVINARTRGMSVDLAVTADLAAVSQKLNGGAAQLTTASQVSATAFKFNGTAVALTSQAQLTAEPLRIKTSTVAMQVTGIELAAVVKIAQGYCQAFDVNTTISVQAVKTARATANLPSQVTTSIQAQKIKNAQATLSAQVTVEADVGKTKEFGATLSTQFAQASTAHKTARIDLAIQAQSTQVTIALRTRGVQATLTAFDTQLTVGRAIRTLSAQLTASTTMLTTTGNIVRAVINLQVQAFELTDASVIRYDPYYKIAIQPETRTHQIHRETRFITIKPETRVNIIKDQI